MSNTRPTCVDCHAHLAPLSFLQEIEGSAKAFGVDVAKSPEGYSLTFPNLASLRPAGGKLVDLAGRTPWMDGERVAVQVTGIWLDIAGYTLAPQHEVEWVHLFNEHLAAEAKAAGERFAALAALPVRSGEAAARELQHAVQTLGMVGAMIPSDPVDVDMASGDLEPLWEAAAALGAPILLHGATHSKWSHFGPPYLGVALGRPLDTTVLVAKLLLSGLLDRHPGLKLGLCHGGGALPYLIGRIEDGYQSGSNRTADLQRNGPTEYLRDLYYDTVTLNTRSARLLLDVAGADHVMLGSDYVWGPMIRDFSGAAQAATTNDSEWANVSSGTAQRLFGLET